MIGLEKAQRSYSVLFVPIALQGQMEKLGWDPTILLIFKTNSFYWQVEIAEEDGEKTKFASHNGLYLFIILSFDSKSRPDEIWRAMDVIFSTIRRQSE